MNEKTKQLLSKPRYLWEVAGYYSVDIKTLKSWIKADGLIIYLPKKGYYVKRNNLLKIIEIIGEME